MMDTQAAMTLLLASRFFENGAMDLAESHCRQALAAAPTHHGARLLLAAIQKGGNKFEDSRHTLRGLLRTAPQDTEVLDALGKVSRAMGEYRDAEDYFRRVAELTPNQPDVLGSLGREARRRHAYREAEDYFRRAVAADPDCLPAWRRLGATLEDMGRIEEAVEVYRRALDYRPDDVSLRTALLNLANLLPDTTPEIIATQRRDFGAKLDREDSPAKSLGRDPSRRLRVGYMSGNFALGDIGFFIAPVLANHDAAGFEVYCYDNGAQDDDLTWRLRDSVSRWRIIRNLDDDQLAHMIHEDRIDILIDLSGFRERGRLPFLAQRRAPLQIAWMGAEGSTGLSAMDAYISDGTGVKPGEDAAFREKVVRLPHGFLCYGPPPYAPLVQPPPSWARGHVTFGCFSGLARLNENVMRLWARLLDETAQSRLLLRDVALADRSVVEDVTVRFAACGLPPAKLDLKAMPPHPELMEAYNEIDIALDPFPGSDSLRTCEALWMGVPVVTLPGATIASRHAASHLSAVGLDEWIAPDEAAYVAIPDQALRQPGALSTLRRELRARVTASPLCDAALFTRNLEMALRTLWRDKCLSEPVAEGEGD